MSQNALVVGICGGTGSGKTTLANRIVEAVGDDALLISMDRYYKYVPLPTYEERARINYDHPDAFDMELLADHLRRLKAGEAVEAPNYDFTVHQRREERTHLESRRVIVIEGILLFACRELVDLLDIKIFVDTDADVRILRRILRDVKERERSLDSVISQYLTTVKPMHEAYIEPTKRLADVIVPEGGDNAVAYQMIIAAILRRLEEE